jgi:hypothetical protein
VQQTSFSQQPLGKLVEEHPVTELIGSTFDDDSGKVSPPDISRLNVDNHDPALRLVRVDNSKIKHAIVMVLTLLLLSQAPSAVPVQDICDNPFRLMIAAGIPRRSPGVINILPLSQVERVARRKT